MMQIQYMTAPSGALFYLEKLSIGFAVGIVSGNKLLPPSDWFESREMAIKGVFYEGTLK